MIEHDAVFDNFKKDFLILKYEILHISLRPSSTIFRDI